MYASGPRFVARSSRLNGLARAAVPPRSFSAFSGHTPCFATRSTHHGSSSSRCYATTQTPRRFQLPAALAAAAEAAVVKPPASKSRAPQQAKASAKPQIAVIGGGLTGLATAWRLSRFMEDAHITLYEASSRLGGWIDTETVQVTTPDGERGVVRFERGGRMIEVPAPGKLKFDDLALYELIYELDLESEVVGIPRTEPALDRYIFYPDHLVKLPSFATLRKGDYLGAVKLGVDLALKLGFGREKLFEGAIPAALHAKFKWVATPIWESVDDKSIGEYYSEALGGKQLVDRALSAMMHGIWGGDVWRLSAERDFAGRSAGNHFDRKKNALLMAADDVRFIWKMQMDRSVEMLELAYRLNENRMLWFRDGFQTLTKALEAGLRKRGNVTIKTSTPVESIGIHKPTGHVTVKTKDGQGSATYSKVVSTILAKTLSSLAEGSKLPSLAKTHAVTMQVVNLWYPTPGLNKDHRGIGYLVSGSREMMLEDNPENALGVLFDSDRELAGLSPTGERSPGDTVPGTKFTVMMGGHLWDGLPSSMLPDAKHAANLAKAVVERHLGIPKSESDRAVASSKVCRECIPQHYVGHWKLMAQARDELQSAFGGRLAVAGPSYQAPGITSSLRAGREVADWVAKSMDEAAPFWKAIEPRSVGDTGLDRFIRGQELAGQWTSCNVNFLPLRFGPTGQLGAHRFHEIMKTQGEVLSNAMAEFYGATQSSRSPSVLPEKPLTSPPPPPPKQKVKSRWLTFRTRKSTWQVSKRLLIFTTVIIAWVALGAKLDYSDQLKKAERKQQREARLMAAARARTDAGDQS